MARITDNDLTLAAALSRRPAKPRGRGRIRRVPVHCGICGGLINPALKAPHPGSYSIDHKLPKAWGGSDLRANLQPAHLGCNKSKGARPTLAELLSA